MLNPRDVAVDEDDRLWVVNAESSGSIFFFDSNGSFRAVFNPSGNGALQNPAGIGVYTDDGDTFVIVADTGNNRVVKFRHDNDNTDGLTFIDAAGQAGSGSDRFNQPLGVAADTCGNFFVADRLNNRIQRLDQDLKFKNPLESGFNRPTDAALSLNGGSLYIADSENNRIQKFNLS
jgi:DNA-binding beta-propeller fold protein YncE